MLRLATVDLVCLKLNLVKHLLQIIIVWQE